MARARLSSSISGTHMVGGRGKNMLCGCVRTTTSTRPSPVSAKAFLTAGLLSYALIVVICPENSRRPPKFLKLRAGSTILTGCDGILDTSSPASSQRSAVGIDMARRGTEAPPRARAAAGRTTLRSISVRYVLPRRAARLKGREAAEKRGEQKSWGKLIRDPGDQG